MRKVKRLFSLLLLGILTFSCCIFFSSCDLEPSEIDVWYMTSYQENGKVYGIGTVYKGEVLNETSITATFANGRVTLDKFGETREGRYEYSNSKLFQEIPSKLIILFDDGGAYEGDCYSAVFDGRSDHLYFEGNNGERYEFSPRDTEWQSFETEFLYSDFEEVTPSKENFFESDYLTDEYTFECTFTQGDRTAQITDRRVITQFLAKAKETPLRPFTPYFYPSEEYTYVKYEFTFEFEEAISWYPVIRKTITFYYDSEVDFFFVLDGNMQYANTRYGISAQKDSAFSYLVQMPKA